MDNQKTNQLWDRLENEPERAYRAFESFLTLPSGERTILAAYKHHVGNPDAAKPSDTWSRWSSQFAWRERTAAYDEHLTSMRREAYERGIEEEAKRQGALFERTRNQMNELMTLSYVRAIECLEDESWVSSNLRASDVIQIVKLHMEAVKTFSVAEGPKVEEDWTEEDEAVVTEIMKQIEAEEAHEGYSGEDEEHSEESEDEQD